MLDARQQELTVVADLYKFQENAAPLPILNFDTVNSLIVCCSFVYSKSGIPQGSNSSPLMADLTLTYFEYVYFVSHPNLYLFIPFRYIDDILVVHNSNFNDIYNKPANVYSCVLNLDITHDKD